jgi:urease accessory protein
MVLGGSVAIAGMHLPGVELGIVASVIVLGMLLIFARSGATVPAALLVSGFALFHGYAHGAEMPAAAGAATYALGFAFATAALHGLGLLGGQWLQARHWQRAVQVLGALISMAGVSMALSM